MSLYLFSASFVALALAIALSDSELLLLLGFGAVLFTYLGNLFFGGLHSDAGLR